MVAAMVNREQRAIRFASGRVVVGGRDWKRDLVAVGLLGDLKWVWWSHSFYQLVGSFLKLIQEDLLSLLEIRVSL